MNSITPDPRPKMLSSRPSSAMKGVASLNSVPHAIETLSPLPVSNLPRKEISPKDECRSLLWEGFV